MKKILMMLAAAVALVSCNMDFYSSDTMTSSMLKEDPGAAVYTTDGIYSMFKDKLDYQSGMYSGYTYARLLFLMTELRGDNTCLSGRTTDPLYEDAVYGDNPQTMDLTYFWFASYKIIFAANSNIESIPEGSSTESDHMLGENYFIRALAHLNLCNIFATPYTRGPEKPGVVVRNSTDCSVTVRGTVGEAYELIVSDLKNAARLMQNGTRRGNAGYASYDAARGLLTRVYLYMGEYELCYQLAEEMFADAGGAAANLDDITTYFADTRDSNETLWCIGKSATDADYSNKSQLASMYYSPDAVGGTGWCEIYWSDPLMELIFRHPEDKRLAYFSTFSPTDDGTKMIHYPVIDKSNGFRQNANIHRIKNFDMDAEVNDNITIITPVYKTYNTGKDSDREVVGEKDSLTKNVVYRKEVNGYPVYYMKGIYTDAEDNDGFDGGTRVYVRDNVSAGFGVRQTYPAYAMSKFSWQDNDPMLSSHAVLRWAEVVLNAAEAYAHSGNIAKALEYTNVIRTRAGIPAWTESAYKAEGYTDIVDVVLDERRLELCFEGHRAIDLYRNGKPIDRRFAGVHDWEVIDMDGLDKRFPYCIPYAEISVSGISGNGKQ